MITHCQLLNTIRTNVNNESLKTLLVALDHGSYGLSARSHKNCQDTSKEYSSTIGSQMEAGINY